MPRKVYITLTPKQIRTLISSLRSTAGIRSKESEREYLRQLTKKIEEQRDAVLTHQAT